MKIIKRKTLTEYGENHADVRDELNLWFATVNDLEWTNADDVKNSMPNARPIGDNRVIFNIKSGNYRLVVKINYFSKTLFVKFIGTHAE